MRRGLIFSLSIVILFFSASIFTYSQNKTSTVDKNTKQTTQVKQVAPKTNKTMVKAVNLKTNKKTVKAKTEKKNEKTAKVEGKKVTKTKTSKTTKELRHHKKMEPKTVKPKTDTTPLKK